MLPKRDEDAIVLAGYAYDRGLEIVNQPISLSVHQFISL